MDISQICLLLFLFDDRIIDQHCINRKSEYFVLPWIRRVGICSRLWYTISWNVGFKKKWLPSDSKLNFVFEWIHSDLHLFLPNPTPWSDYITHYINIYFSQRCHISFVNWKWHSFQNWELCSNICTHIMTFSDNVTQVDKVFALENTEGTYSVEVLPAKYLLWYIPAEK